MSIPEKIEYGGAPRTFNQSCLHGIEPQTAQYLTDFLNNLAVSIYALGNPRIAGGSDADNIPLSDPPRNKVRFKLQSGFTGGAATAWGVDGDKADLTTPTFTVYDPMGRYTTAGSGDYGIASYYQHPDGSYRLEVDVLGGEGTVTGTANDELVAANNDDALNGNAGYLVDKIDNQAAKTGSWQQVYYAVNEDAGDYTLDFWTSSVSATDNYTVRVSGSDTNPNFLKESVATTPQNYIDADDYQEDDHQKVYFVVEGSGDEKFSLRTKRSEDTGKVKVSTGDGTLEYLYEKFADIDTYDSSVHQLVYCDDTGAPRSDMRLFTPSTLCAKITAQIPARSGDDYGQGTADLGYITGAGAWTAIVEYDDATVWNPAAVTINVPSNLTSIHIPVSKVNGEWVLQGVFDPYQLGNWTYLNAQSIGHNASNVPEWQDDGVCP